MVWDYFIIITLVISSIALYFVTINIIKKVHRGEETFGDTVWGCILFAYIVVCFFMRISSIFKYI